jgi:hypothetical protein
MRWRHVAQKGFFDVSATILSNNMQGQGPEKKTLIYPRCELTTCEQEITKKCSLTESAQRGEFRCPKEASAGGVDRSPTWYKLCGGGVKGLLPRDCLLEGTYGW